jgi:hypothetical protein
MVNSTAPEALPAPHMETITTNVVSSNPVHGEVYSIQHNVLKFVSVGSFLRELRFPPPIKTDRQDIAEILLTSVIFVKTQNGFIS